MFKILHKTATKLLLHVIIPPGSFARHQGLCKQIIIPTLSGTDEPILPCPKLPLEPPTPRGQFPSKVAWQGLPGWIPQPKGARCWQDWGEPPRQSRDLGNVRAPCWSHLPRETEPALESCSPHFHPGRPSRTLVPPKRGLDHSSGGSHRSPLLRCFLSPPQTLSQQTVAQLSFEPHFIY